MYHLLKIFLRKRLTVSPIRVWNYINASSPYFSSYSCLKNYQQIALICEFFQSSISLRLRSRQSILVSSDCFWEIKTLLIFIFSSLHFCTAFFIFIFLFDSQSRLPRYFGGQDVKYYIAKLRSSFPDSILLKEKACYLCYLTFCYFCLGRACQLCNVFYAVDFFRFTSCFSVSSSGLQCSLTAMTLLDLIFLQSGFICFLAGQCRLQNYFNISVLLSFGCQRVQLNLLPQNIDMIISGKGNNIRTLRFQKNKSKRIFQLSQNRRDSNSQLIFIISKQQLSKNNSKMSTFPHCCDTNTLYIGLDSQCNKPAVLCTAHATHPNPTGIMHNIMPVPHFRSVVNELKFQMSDKVAALIQQYLNFMDELIAEVTELKVRKSIQMSTLWVRELAQTEEQYEHFKKIFRNDFQGFTCKQIANFYDKMLRGVNIKEKKLDDIQCYKEIGRVMEKLQNSAKARMLIVQKVADLEGIVQNGDLLKRALPDRKVLKENTKQILLETPNIAQIDIRYNKAFLKKGGVNYRSIFSKYSLLPNTNYHLTINTKYTNILIGVCSQEAKRSNQINDLHYNIHALTYNCSNGCIYRDAMFESGSAHLTKSKKNLELILRINDSEMLILMDKNVVCRTKLKQFAKNTLYLHILMRTEGDSFEIDSDKMNTFEPVVQEERSQNEVVQEVIEIVNTSLQQDLVKSSLASDKYKYVPQKFLEEKKDSYVQDLGSSEQRGLPPALIQKFKTFGDNNTSAVVQELNKSHSQSFQQHPFLQSTQNKVLINNLEASRKKNRKQSIVNIKSSLFASNDSEQFMGMKKFSKNESKTSQKQTLPMPVVIPPVRRSQLEDELKDSKIEYLSTIKVVPKLTSGVQQIPSGLRITELYSSQSI